MNKLQPVRGTQDILNEDYDFHKFCINTFESVTYCRGFKGIKTPIIEHSEVFKKTLGSTSDIIKKETYTFKDRSDNELTLRPEGTAPVIRSFINNKLHEPLPQKFTYTGPMFRYDRPQKGRLRQFYQLGAEIIGEKDISADLELISVSKSFVNALGISDKNFEIQVNSLGDEKSRQKYVIELKNFFQDYKKELSIESLERLGKNSLRILDTKNEKEKKLLEKAPKLKNFLSTESSDIFEEFKEQSKELKIPIVLNNNLVRGLDYYNNICYEFIPSQGESSSQDTFLAGGRYDGLIKKMGGPDYPGCGFAAGLERMHNMHLNYGDDLKDFSGFQLFHVSEKCTAIVVGKENKIKALKIINEIMEQQSNVIKDGLQPFNIDLICKDNLSKGLKYAKDTDAKWAIIIGEDEILKQQLIIKDLKKQTQKKVKIKELIKSFSK